VNHFKQQYLACDDNVNQTGADPSGTLFVSLGNRPFAELVTRGGEQKTLWLLLDHLGSVIQKTDALGQVVWGDNFTPFGTSAGEFGTDLEENGLFTGKELDPPDSFSVPVKRIWRRNRRAPVSSEQQSRSILFRHFNARWYDPKLGRFITEDPARDGSNWYGYCSNNPLKYVDPTGLEFKVIDIPFKEIYL
jgi:RHS repeat-associated protein